MYYFDKERTFLNQFNETTKIGYDKIGNKKFVFWLIVWLISTAIQLIPMLALIIGFNVIYKTVLASKGADAILNWIGQSIWGEWFELVITTGFVIISFFVYIKLIEKRPFRSIGLNSIGKLRKYLKGAAIAIGMQLTYFIIISIFNWGEIVHKPIYATNGLGASAVGFVFIFLIGFIIQGASEEVVVRGWMLPVMSRHYGVGISVVLSSLYFSFLHMFNPNVGVLPIINLFLYGSFAAIYALYDDGLWGIFAYHSIWNWFMGNVLGLPVSGMIIGGVSIIETQLTGPAWITGGAFGPEGGIVVSVILIISIFIFLKLLLSKGVIKEVD